MSMKPETLFRRRVEERLKMVPNSWWETIQQKTIVGSPDKMGCVSGHFVALELKADVKSPVTKMQEFKLKQVELSGGFAALVYPGNLDEVILKLIEISKRRPHDHSIPSTDPRPIVRQSGDEASK